METEVLARYFCIDKNIDKSSTQKYMQSIVDEMLPKGKAADSMKA